MRGNQGRSSGNRRRVTLDVQEFRVALIAADFDKTSAFYRDVLGLSVDESWERPDGRGVIFRCGGGYIEILDETSAAHVADVSGGHELALVTKPAGLVIGVADVDGLHRRLNSRRVGPISSLWNAPWGHRGFRVADPDGFVLTFFSRHSS